LILVSLTSSSNPHVKFWVVVPAAGIGARMTADRPKQYLPLAGKTVIEQSLDRLLNHPTITAAVVAISRADEYWAELNYAHKKSVQLALGGQERCDSVLSALQVLQQTANENDWVLVHDAARPCLRATDIDRLIQRCKDHPVGGILAVPVKDTIKQSTSAGEVSTISTTVDRSTLWHAQTPQMFRLGMLRDALSKALAAGVSITDEASAMEWAGHKPLLVEGHGDNIKITCPEDLPLAEFYFSQSGSTSN
jgi:2-C-methyl-D-erythritol 4-phosphate cytidylyltransferase